MPRRQQLVIGSTCINGHLIEGVGQLYHRANGKSFCKACRIEVGHYRRSDISGNKAKAEIALPKLKFMEGKE